MILRTWSTLLVFCIGAACVPNAWAYRKYYVEDECISPDEFQKVFFRLPASGSDSVGELRPNRFGTYSRMGRNCLIKLVPPKGHGVILTVLKVDFRNHDGCKDYIKVYENDEDGEILCGFQDLGQNSKTYFSDNELKILYHTSEGGMGFSNGFKLIFTVTQLDAESGACESPDQFQCGNLRCIWAGVKCDGINNCGDGSDEGSTNQAQCSGDLSPVAIAAVILGVISFLSIIFLLCSCCCRVEPEKTNKPYLVENFLLRPNAGYTPLPGYNPLPGNSYGTLDTSELYPQPIHSPALPASAPPYTPSCCPNYVPYTHQKIDIRNDEPPPYAA